MKTTKGNFGPNTSGKYDSNNYGSIKSDTAFIDSLKLPEGYTLASLNELFNVAKNEYAPAFRRARKLDATDKGRLWQAVKASFPSYQILPDTNYVSYVKQNLLASIYTVGKSAKLIPTSEKDKDIVEQLNIAMEHVWSELDVARFQTDAGERAALLNYGLTQVGWDNNVVVGTGDTFRKGEVVLKNINPLHFMRDPFAIDLDHASWCVTWEQYHKSVIAANRLYKTQFDKYLKMCDERRNDSAAVIEEFASDRSSGTSANKKDYYTVYTYWVNDNGKIHEFHIVNNEFILAVKTDIKPSCYPFAELYCNAPSNELHGTSECAKIFNNNLAYNIMSSIILTSEFKNQRPPRFVNGQSGINIATFVKHGNDADRTFVVQGDASKAVSYQQFPQPTAQATTSMQLMEAGIKQVSGVDDRYTGRDTGSMLTTGAVEAALDQVTMIDAPKVENYERYCKKLTSLIVYNYLTFGWKRKYFNQNPNTLEWSTVDVDFPNISADTLFSYEMMISSELPKNKSRVEAVANHLMEMQMQYQAQGIDVDLITPEEWLMMQDLPMREYMQERMGIQRTQNWLSIVSQAVTQYTGMVQNGVTPEDAIAATADTMQRQSQPTQGGDPLEQQMQSIQNNPGVDPAMMGMI